MWKLSEGMKEAVLSFSESVQDLGKARYNLILWLNRVKPAEASKTAWYHLPLQGPCLQPFQRSAQRPAQRPSAQCLTQISALTE